MIKIFEHKIYREMRENSESIGHSEQILWNSQISKYLMGATAFTNAKEITFIAMDMKYTLGI